MNESDRRLESELSAYLDGELDAAQRAEVEAALAHSPALARRLERLRAVDAALRGLPSEAPSEALAEALHTRIRAAEARSRRDPPRRRRLLAALAAAAAGLALLVYALRPPAPAPEAPQPLAGDEGPSPADVALAVELDGDSDLEVVEVLDILEVLGDLESERESG